MFDLAVHLSDDRTLRALREVIQRFRDLGSCLILIDHDDKLPDVIAAEATALEISLPDAAELEHIIRNTLRNFHREQPVQQRWPSVTCRPSSATSAA